MKRVLSIDGGGIRGIVPCRVLMEFEKLSGCRIATLFDLLAGTSTGGILACGLTIPGTSGMPEYTAEEMLALYLKWGGTIFKRPWYATAFDRFGLFDHKYPDTGLAKALTQYFGTVKLSHALTEIIVTAYDIERNQPVLFKSRKARVDPTEDIPMFDAAMSTAAAPTYFPPHNQYVDGGVFAADPGMCAYAEARANWPGEEILLVSLGTGFRAEKWSREDAHGWGVAAWAKPLIDILLDGNMLNVDYQLKTLLPAGNYFRIQGELPKDVEPGMDGATDENMQKLAEFGTVLTTCFANQINQALNTLTGNCQKSLS